jgi:hypothetical protein
VIVLQGETFEIYPEENAEWVATLEQLVTKQALN